MGLRTRYGTDEFGWWRMTRKPVDGSVKVALGDVGHLSGWSVDATTGILTIGASPAAGVEVAAGFEFDLPCSFDDDLMDVTLDIERLGSITSIPLVKLRLPEPPSA